MRFTGISFTMHYFRHSPLPLIYGHLPLLVGKNPRLTRGICGFLVENRQQLWRGEINLTEFLNMLNATLTGHR